MKEEAVRKTFGEFFKKVFEGVEHSENYCESAMSNMEGAFKEFTVEEYSDLSEKDLMLILESTLTSTVDTMTAQLTVFKNLSMVYIDILGEEGYNKLLDYHITLANEVADNINYILSENGLLDMINAVI